MKAQPTYQRVHIVDDDNAMREALVWLFDSRGLATETYRSAEEFIDRYHEKEDASVECLLLDIRMDGMSGLELQEYLAAKATQMPIIFLTGHANVPIAVRALRRGAIDIIEKPFNDNELVDRVLLALKQQAECLGTRREQQLAKERLNSLTPRDREVLEKMLQGKYNKVIADELDVSMRTVEVHRSTILRKMGVRTAVELAHLLGTARGQSDV
jgi:two-component system response regulator DctR